MPGRGNIKCSKSRNEFGMRKASRPYRWAVAARGKAVSSEVREKAGTTLQRNSGGLVNKQRAWMLF